MSFINPMEAASSLAMCVVATWTVSTAAHRALSMRHILRDSGEMQPVVDQRSAMCLPVISSATLLTLYFLFKYIQNFLVCYMVIASFGAVSICVYEPLALHWSPLVTRLRCSRLSLTQDGASYLSALLAGAMVLTWLLTSHWIVLNILGVCITISVVSLIRLPSLKVAAILLVSLFFYDIFWVFCSPYIFESNVMVEVATKKASNPAQVFGEYLNVPGLKDASTTLQLPIKLMFPAGFRNGSPIFHMLGLGDMAIPGIFVAFALAFDEFKEDQEGDVVQEGVPVVVGSSDALLKQRKRGTKKGNGNSAMVTENIEEGPSGIGSCRMSETLKNDAKGARFQPPPDATVGNIQVLSSSCPVASRPKHKPYFNTARFGYIVGILASIGASQWFGAAQPALLYLVPAVLGPMILRARHFGHLKELWVGFPRDEIEEYRSMNDVNDETFNDADII
jgi:hypothetical protein